ncbi:outer membrane protein beta-barrel domain [Lentimicrobium saccharophilum]|uniref:Outer membrane protein beta-barrel domain n=1 Tax=Lentimicrobium saccharophilum TaxID=1678841 RepID=A0A0S7BWJ6_9BACT|nr:porin family protein [Lentimicrobium saccharophilum]GAP44957.1 outer membrane protein beta-barrel domain [Lentimicrobium saccharophilum]
MRRKAITIIFAIVLIALMSPGVHAQRLKVRNLPAYDLAPYHFGFILGMNQMLFSIRTTPGFQNVTYSSLQTPDLYSDSARLLGLEHKPAFGFTIGIVSNLRLAESFDLRFVPSLSFGERDLEYSIITNFEGERDQILVNKKMQSTFVEFPLHIKYKGSRLNNVRPYWLAGAKYAIDLASDSKKKEENNNIYVALNRSDLYGELGAGFDFYTTFFKFGIELKMSYGLSDILKREGNIYTGAVDRLNSKLFLLSFTFE